MKAACLSALEAYRKEATIYRRALVHLREGRPGCGTVIVTALKQGNAVRRARAGHERRLRHDRPYVLPKKVLERMKRRRARERVLLKELAVLRRGGPLRPRRPR